MKWYRLYDIEWDTDGDENAEAALPRNVHINSKSSIETLRAGEAADILADEYGFCVKSLKVDEEKE